MEVLGLIISALIWFFKAAVANEDKKSNAELKEKNEESGGQSSWKPRTYADVLTGSMSVGGAMQNISDALDGLGARRGKKTISAAEMRQKFEHAGAKRRPSPTEIKEFHERRRADEWEKSEQRHAAERAGSEKRWEAARQQQADAALVHGVHIDSCEGRLESLKVLYDAGILDREEYLQRVSRVKRQHADSRG